MDYNTGRYVVAFTAVLIGLCGVVLLCMTTGFFATPVIEYPRHVVSGLLMWRGVVVSAGTTGDVDRLFVRIGDPVDAGDPLMRLDTESSSAALDKARERLEEAEKGLDAAEESLESSMDQLEYARGRYLWTRSMYERGAVARMELVRTEDEREFAERLEERARTEYEAAKEEYDEATEFLSLMESRFDASFVTAPVDGFVASLFAWEGGSFLRGEEMMTIAVAGEIYARTSSLPDAGIEPGDDVWIIAMTPLPQVLTGYAAGYDSEGAVSVRLRLDGGKSYRGLFVMGERLFIVY